MHKRLVIFGVGDTAQLADFYFKQDTDYDVVAFTVDAAYASRPSAFGRPLVAFEDLPRLYPPEDHAVFVALGYSQLNRLRRRKYEEAKALGYPIAAYLSSRAIVWPGFTLEENGFILEGNNLQPFVRVGPNVTLWSGNHIGHHSTIGAHSFLTSHVVVSGGVTIGEHCFVGVNSTLRDRVTVGDACMLGAGTLLLADAEPGGVYAPSPTERSRVPSSRLRRI